MGVLRYSSMMRWNSTRLRAASLQARSRGSLHVSTWDGLSMPQSRPWAAPSYSRMKATASFRPCVPTLAS